MIYITDPNKDDNNNNNNNNHICSFRTSTQVVMSFNHI